MNGIFRLISWYLETTHNVPQNMFNSKIQNFRNFGFTKFVLVKLFYSAELLKQIWTLWRLNTAQVWTSIENDWLNIEQEQDSKKAELKVQESS